MYTKDIWENCVVFEKKFYELIRNHYDIIKDERKFKSLLYDYFPQEKKWERNALLFLYNQKIMKEIEKNPEMTLTTQLHFKNELKSEYGITERNAKRAVDIWINSYGKWIEEQNELVERIIKLSELNEGVIDVEELENIFENVVIYPKAFKKVYLLCSVLKSVDDYYEKTLGYKNSEHLMLYLYSKESNILYEEYLEVFIKFLNMKWECDYSLYGFFLLSGYRFNVKKLRCEHYGQPNIEQGMKWLRYFYEILNKRKNKALFQLSLKYKSSAFNKAEIMMMLGVCYATGNYFIKDEKKAADCWNNMLNKYMCQFTDKGNATCCLEIVGKAYLGEKISVNICMDPDYGEIFNMTMKIRKNMKRAYKFLAESVEYGSEEAIYILAQMYERGTGITKDMNHAVELYQQAADEGWEEAKEWLKEHSAEIEKERVSSND